MRRNKRTTPLILTALCLVVAACEAPHPTPEEQGALVARYEELALEREARWVRDIAAGQVSHLFLEVRGDSSEADRTSLALKLGDLIGLQGGDGVRAISVYLAQGGGEETHFVSTWYDDGERHRSQSAAPPEALLAGLRHYESEVSFSGTTGPEAEPARNVRVRIHYSTAGLEGALAELRARALGSAP